MEFGEKEYTPDVHSGPGPIFLIQGAARAALVVDGFGGSDQLSVISYQSQIAHWSLVTDH